MSRLMGKVLIYPGGYSKKLLKETTVKIKPFLKKFILKRAYPILASVIASIIFALLVYVWCNYCNFPYDICGKWEFKTNTQESSHKEFEGLSVYFDVVFNQNETGFVGTGEKIAEENGEGERYDFEREKRIRLDITGNVKNNFLKNDQVTIHWVEHGRKRDTSSHLDLIITGKNTMQGSFVSTAADSKGKVYCIRKE